MFARDRDVGARAAADKGKVGKKGHKGGVEKNPMTGEGEEPEGGGARAGDKGCLSRETEATESHGSKTTAPGQREAVIKGNAPSSEPGCVSAPRGATG